ncbi:hypothetical protein DL89DRAFT_121746 [Linderina pennispora]|uniref:Uncharacterized protein n=1 Tax=Linderina pennispora TaxID=61395 RepID=A0A1Y1WCQ7_9FUNG|nr:uncharacterized protein DL89DRAFT_121746 [Linderina pennispora]ORX71222.1 hypothetical protein DL89DRAFT_121746 [Linderina pennispora]
MYIHYSDRNSSTNNITGTGQGNESDGDDIPLASIIRSKSEPSVYPARHSVDAHLARLNANGDEQSRTYDSDNHNSAAAAADLYQPRRFLSRRPRAADKDSKVNNQVTKFENIRSFSMDNGSRPLKKPVSAAATQAPPKRKFRKWGGIF